MADRVGLACASLRPSARFALRLRTMCSFRTAIRHGAMPSAMRRGGQGGIRTHEGLAPLPVFKTGAFNRSATCPLSARPASALREACHGLA